MTEQQAAEWLLERDNFLFLTHVRPDGDTLGCATALCLALQALGKTAWTLPNPGVTPDYRDFLDFQWAPEGYVPEHIVSVDVADEQLFPQGYEAYVGKSQLCIDHHPSNRRYAPNLCLDEKASACGEMVYRICTHLGVMTEPVARALYVAITTDNGCFVYSSTTPESHRIAAALMEYGDFAKRVNKHFFQTRTRKELLLQSRLMAALDFYEDGKVAIGALTLADKASVGATDADCSELSSFLATIEGVKCAALLRELRDGVFKVSMRGDEAWLNVSDVCALMGGGGHAAAAGASLSNVTPDEGKRTVYQAIMKVLKG